ncbi:hypothetical protein N657DRAFT_642023 [Parathielavia appendiculata]|uniref:Secreted protein n=1 Tax=Parathielavia appendiculata TaxID=2587402 RepID=A0AAN6U7P2_9PEZI|nr:hypothetical protein N657DRAFT_642023 [Parathielavia appendiculata]
MLASLSFSILGAAAVALAVLATPASAATYAGVVDMRQACVWRYGDGCYNVNVRQHDLPTTGIAFTLSCLTTTPSTSMPTVPDGTVITPTRIRRASACMTGDASSREADDALLD